MFSACAAAVPGCWWAGLALALAGRAAVFVAVAARPDLRLDRLPAPLRRIRDGPIFVAIPLGLLTTAAFDALSRTRGLGPLAAAASAGAAAGPGPRHGATGRGAGAGDGVRGRGGGGAAGGSSAFPVGRHVGFWAIPVVVLALNAFWWLPAIWLVSTKGGWDLAFDHPEPVLGRLWQIVASERPTDRDGALGCGSGGRGRACAAPAGARPLASGHSWRPGFSGATWRGPSGRSTPSSQAGKRTPFTRGGARGGIAARRGRRSAPGRAGPGGSTDGMALGMVLVGLRLFGPALAESLEVRLRGPPAVPLEPPHSPIPLDRRSRTGARQARRAAPVRGRGEVAARLPRHLPRRPL